MDAISLRDKLKTNHNLCRLENRGNKMSWFSTEFIHFNGEYEFFRNNVIDLPCGHFTRIDKEVEFQFGYWQHFGGRCADTVIFASIKPIETDKADIKMKYNKKFYSKELNYTEKFQFCIEPKGLDLIFHGVVEGCKTSLSHPLAGFEISINNIIVRPCDWHPTGFVNAGKIMMEELILYMARHAIIVSRYL